MNAISKKSLFITLEGPEGCGKTTQGKRICAYLTENNIPYVFTREPGGGKISEQIRSILLSPENKNMYIKTELLLYLASRAQHTKEIIIPALASGKVVVCDRFIDASVAYQGYGRDLDIDLIDKMNMFCIDGNYPDLTFIFDIDVARGLQLAKSGKNEFNQKDNLGDRIEQENIDFHKRVREGYIAIAKKYPERIRLIKVDDTIDAIFSRIRIFLDPMLDTLNK